MKYSIKYILFGGIFCISFFCISLTQAATNSAPIGVFDSVSQIPDGTGKVKIVVHVSDAQEDIVKGRLEYEEQGEGLCNGPWQAATLAGPVSADLKDTNGFPNIDNTQYFPLGSEQGLGIKTNSQPNKVIFYWDSKKNIDNRDRNYCLRFTVNDGTDTSVASTNVVHIDNLAPRVIPQSIKFKGGSGKNGALIIGDTAIMYWDNSVTGDNNDDIVQVTEEDGDTMTDTNACSGIPQDRIYESCVPLGPAAFDKVITGGIKAVDEMGNITRATSSTKIAVDLEKPKVSQNAIKVTQNGNTLTATWDNTIDNNKDVTLPSQVFFDFSAFGGLKNVPASRVENRLFYASIIVSDPVAFTKGSVSVLVQDDQGNWSQDMEGQAPVQAPTIPDGQTAPAGIKAGELVKGTNPTIYYVASNLQRYEIPDPVTYFSWFSDFSSVKTISNEVLASLPIGGLLTVKPGTTLLKGANSPDVYAVDISKTLRLIPSESLAIAIYGTNWQSYVKEISPSVLEVYEKGTEISDTSSYNKQSVLQSVTSIEQVLGLKEVVKQPACTSSMEIVSFLEIGSNNAEVLAMQKLLQCLSYFPQNVQANGNFGPATESAVKAFQKANGIKQAGYVGPSTRNALNAYMIKSNTSVVTETKQETVKTCEGTTVFTSTLQRGSESNEVKSLQEVLKCLKFFPSNVIDNGYFGPTTEASVKKLQEANALPATGIVDTKTRAILNSSNVSPESFPVIEEEKVVTQKNCTSEYTFDAFLEVGAVGEEVRELQKLLICLGYFSSNYSDTAFYGSVTETAVKAFQKDNGIEPAGYVGPSTRKLLNSY